jgi:predicted PurR-regulated permease PerM
MDNANGLTKRQSAPAAFWLVAVLGAAIVWAVFPYAAGIVGAGVLYVLTAPLYRYLARPLGGTTAFVITVVAVCVLLLLPLMWLIAVAAGEAPQVIEKLSTTSVLTHVPDIQIGSTKLRDLLPNLTRDVMSWSSRQALSIFATITLAVLNLVIAFTGLYYLLAHHEKVWRGVRPFLPFSDATAELLRVRFFEVTESMVLGTGVTAVLQGTVVGIAFWLAGVSNALFWGLVTCFASILPVVGSGIVWVPAAAVLALQHRYRAALFILIIGIAVASTIDNIARPLVYRRVANVHPMITLVGAFAGVSVFGFIGVLLGPLAISYFFELAKAYHLEYGTTTASE